jgi:putative redox protein
MAALGTCTAMTLKMYANRKKWDLEEIIVFLNHDKVHRNDGEEFEKNNSKVSRFIRNIEFMGEIDEQKKEKLLEIADKCPVHRTLKENIIIETKII